MECLQASEICVLVVDDRPEFNKSMVNLLQERGITAVPAYDFTDAINQIVTRKGDFDYAIVDLNLPSSISRGKYEGFRVLDALLEHDCYAIVLSGYISPEIARTLSTRPEVLHTIDKIRFSTEGYVDAFFDKLDAVLQIVIADKIAEGRCADQMARLVALKV